MARLAEALAASLRERAGAEFRFRPAGRRGFSSRTAARRASRPTKANGSRRTRSSGTATSRALADGALGPEAARAVAATPPGERSLSALTWAMSARTDGFPAGPPQRVLLARLPGGIRRHLRARAPAGRPDRLCLRAGSRRRRRAAKSSNRRRAPVLPRQRARARQRTCPSPHAEMRSCESAAFGLLERCGLRIERDPELDPANDAGGFRAPLSGDAGSALWPGDARLEGVVRAGGIDDPPAGPLSGGRQRPSGAGRADGGAVGPAGGDARDAGPCFDQEVEPGGYAWWYVDALSDDRPIRPDRHRLRRQRLLALLRVGGAARSARSLRVQCRALRPRATLWAMTERGRRR